MACCQETSGLTNWRRLCVVIAERNRCCRRSSLARSDDCGDSQTRRQTLSQEFAKAVRRLWRPADSTTNIVAGVLRHSQVAGFAGGHFERDVMRSLKTSDCPKKATSPMETLGSSNTHCTARHHVVAGDFRNNHVAVETPESAEQAVTTRRRTPCQGGVEASVMGPNCATKMPLTQKHKGHIGCRLA